MSSLSFSTATVQLLNADDVASVVEIERQSNSHPWTEKNFHDALASGYLCLLARDHGAVSGFAVARLLVDEAELLLIAVTPAMRRQGVALLLWIDMAERLRASGAQTVHLEVRESNISAQAFYRSRGFTPSGVRPRYYPNGAHESEREDAVLMRASL
jgi:ribosomal-protein-alanine acetyltransferase